TQHELAKQRLAAPPRSSTSSLRLFVSLPLRRCLAALLRRSLQKARGSAALPPLRLRHWVPSSLPRPAAAHLASPPACTAAARVDCGREFEAVVERVRVSGVSAGGAVSVHAAADGGGAGAEPV